MNSVAYCIQPGSAYPWNAVRRYIFDNQGFIKRMYGEHRQSQIIQEEMLRMNDLYDLAPFRSAKSATGPDDNSPKEDITANQTMNAHLSTDTNQTVKWDRENVTTSEQFDTDNEVYSTTVDDDLAGVYGRPTLLEVQEDWDNATTPSSEIENLVDEEKPSKASKGYNACPVTQEVVAPYWANNTRGEILALVSFDNATS